MKLNRSTSPKVITSLRTTRSEFEARLERERRADERYKLTVSVSLVLMICVVAFVVAR